MWFCHISSSRRYCYQSCLLVTNKLLTWRPGRSDLSKCRTLIFVKFGTDVQHLRQMSLLTLRGQGQSSRSKPPYWKYSNGSRSSSTLSLWRMLLQHLTNVCFWRSAESGVTLGKMAWNWRVKQKLKVIAAIVVVVLIVAVAQECPTYGPRATNQPARRFYRAHKVSQKCQQEAQLLLGDRVTRKHAKDSWNGRGNDNLGWNDLQMYFKVIKSGTNRKLVYDFLLVVYSNFCRITHRFWEIWCETV